MQLGLSNTNEDSLSAINYFQKELGFSQTLIKSEANRSWATQATKKMLYQQFKSCIIFFTKPDGYIFLQPFAITFSHLSPSFLLQTVSLKSCASLLKEKQM